MGQVFRGDSENAFNVSLKAEDDDPVIFGKVFVTEYLDAQ